MIKNGWKTFDTANNPVYQCSTQITRQTMNWLHGQEFFVLDAFLQQSERIFLINCERQIESYAGPRSATLEVYTVQSQKNG